METQITAIYKTTHGIKLVTIFGYATNGVPGLEVHGGGKLGKNIKEKIVYMTRIRKLKIPLKRFVLCVDVNELSSQNVQELKWLEFPFLLLYWYLAGLVPIRKLDDCLSSGMIHVSGVITHLVLPPSFREIVKEHFKNECIEQLKIIESSEAHTSSLYQIDTKLLLEHIPLLDVNGSYMESSSAIPIKSFIA